MSPRQPVDHATDPGPIREGPLVAIPPPLASGVIRRPRLEGLLDESVARRLTTVVADAGFGKSTLLATWGQGRSVAWYTITATDRDPAVLAAGIVRSISLRVPALARALGHVLELGRGPQATADEARRAEALAGAIGTALESSLTGYLVLVLDDLETLGRRDAASRFVAAICRHAPARLHVVLSSRSDPPFPIERLRVQGQVLSLTGADLTFTRAETAEFLAASLGPDAEQLADRLHAATGGWPAAIRLATEALARIEPDGRPMMLDRVLRTGDPIVETFVDQVLARETPAVRRLVGTMAAFDRFTAAMAATLGFDDAEAVLGALSRRGLLVQTLGEGDWFAIHPVVRPFALDRLAPQPAALRRLRRDAVRWALANGADIDALAIAGEAGDPALLRRVLETRGPDLVSAGYIEPVIEAAASLTGSARSRTIDRLEGEARQVRGDWDGALTLYRRLQRPGAPLEPAVAWRMGLIHHLRGELDDAVAVYAQGSPTAGGGDADADATQLTDLALLRAWWAAARWLRGDLGEVRELAEAALAAATRSGDHRALAVTHTVLAMQAALDGDRRANDVHYLRALDHAIRGHDVLTQIRIRANRGSRFIEEADYGPALDELDEAIALAEVTGFAIFHALALSNRGEALWRLGRFDEARGDLEQSRQLYQRLDSRMVAYPLGHLGDVYRDRGDRAMARAQYEEALLVAEGSGDLQGLVPALSGLARVLVDDEPDRAAALAARAVAVGPALGRVNALLAQGWVALRTGDEGLARAAVAEAAELSRGRRDRAGLAESLELEAALAGTPDEAGRKLGEARSIWRDIGASVAAARADLALATSSAAGQAASTAARATLAAAGAPVPGGGPGSGSAVDAGARPLEIRALGGFGVVRNGAAVATAAWGSRRARELVKILVSRRGLRVPREQLMELLWPGEDPDRTARRLSVMISTARTVLDPNRSAAPVGWIGADRDAVWLALPPEAIDVERFLAAAAEGFDCLERDPARARTSLADAESMYRGDFLEDDPYVDWAVGLREEARLTCLRVGQALARLAAEAGDTDAAIRHLHRVLEREPYDEPAHLGLATSLQSAGRPAEARRAYRRYVARMEELGVEAAPFPV